LQFVSSGAFGRGFWLKKVAANALVNSTKMSVDIAYTVSAQVASMASRYNA